MTLGAVLWANGSCRCFAVIARARFRRALAVSRSVGSLSRVLAAAAGRPCAALVVVAVEPIVFVTAGAVVVGFSDAGCSGGRRAAGTKTRDEDKVSASRSVVLRPLQGARQE